MTQAKRIANATQTARLLDKADGPFRVPVLCHACSDDDLDPLLNPPPCIDRGGLRRADKSLGVHPWASIRRAVAHGLRNWFMTIPESVIPQFPVGRRSPESSITAPRESWVARGGLGSPPQKLVGVVFTSQVPATASLAEGSPAASTPQQPLFSSVSTPSKWAGLPERGAQRRGTPSAGRSGNAVASPTDRQCSGSHRNGASCCC